MTSIQKFRKTAKGVLTNLYSKINERNRKRGFGNVSFTLDELHIKYLKDKKFIKLYDSWVENNYLTSLKPSFDRLNPLLGYSFDNMQIKTWEENRKKADWEKSFLYTTPVKMYDINGNYLRDFGSIKEAVMATHIRQSGITCCCQGKYSQSGGYIFKYRGDKFRSRNLHDNPELLEEKKNE